MKQKMWDGRFEEGSSELLEEFNASIFFDKKLYKEDITGSLAHAKMLCAIGVLSKDELSSIQSGLGQVLAEIESGKFEFSVSQEDIHMAVEGRLTEIIGEAGKKLHTARSRNDQVAGGRVGIGNGIGQVELFATIDGAGLADRSHGNGRGCGVAATIVAAVVGVAAIVGIAAGVATIAAAIITASTATCS